MCQGVRRGMFGHELLSFLLHSVHKNLSTLDPSSLVFDIAMLFESLTQGMQMPCSGARNKKRPSFKLELFFIRVRREGFEPS